MRVLLETYDRLANSAPQGFISRATFPWIFVVVLNVAIYETLVPDGRSLIDRFAGLHDNLQIYAALGIVIAIAAVAGVSDGVVDLLVNPYRLRHWVAAERHGDSSSAEEFEVTFLQHMTTAEGRGNNPEIKSAVQVFAAIDIANTAVHRSAILVMAFGASILVSTIELARYQENIQTSLTVVILLWVLMAGSFGLTLRQMAILAALDGLARRYAVHSRGSSTNPRLDQEASASTGF